MLNPPACRGSAWLPMPIGAGASPPPAVDPQDPAHPHRTTIWVDLREMRKANFQNIPFTQHSQNDRLLGGAGGRGYKRAVVYLAYGGDDTKLPEGENCSLSGDSREK